MSGFLLRLDLDLEEALDRRLVPDALVVQEDRNLVMGPNPTLDLDAMNGLVAAYQEIARHKPVPQGVYLLAKPTEDRSYWMYQAVVHDLSSTPTTRPGIVRRVMVSVVKDAARRGFRRLAFEPLGVWRSSGLELSELADAVDMAVMELVEDRSLEEIKITLLLASPAELEEMAITLRSRLLRRASRSLRTVSGDAAVVEVRRGGLRLHFKFVPGTPSGYLVTRAGAALEAI